MECKCLLCGNEFKKNKDKRTKNRFCSRKCTLNFYRTREHQIKAGKVAGAANILRLRGTGTKTYIKEYGRHQHRIIMEKKLGRKLIKGEIVHHIDHNKKNNHPDNLQVMTQSEHCTLHMKHRWNKK